MEKLTYEGLTKLNPGIKGCNHAIGLSKVKADVFYCEFCGYEIPDHLKHVEILQAENANLNKALAEVQRELSNAQHNNAHLEFELTTMKAQLAEEEADADACEHAFKRSLEYEKELQAQLTTAQGDVAETQRLLDWSSKRIEQLTYAKNVRESQAADAEGRLADAQGEIERLREAILLALPKISMFIPELPKEQLTIEGYCNNANCPYCSLKKALSASTSEKKEQHGQD